MELPFSLIERKDGTLRYGIALWYRVSAVVIFSVLAFSLASSGEHPSILGWLLLVLSALGVLYEEQWVFGREIVIHRVGVIFAARRTDLSISELSTLRIVPFVRGTVPGSVEESKENEKALYGEAEGKVQGRIWLSGKKPYLLLIIEAKNGDEYTIDRIPARRREWLLSSARRISAVVDIPIDA